jgi:hypothetical protein
VKTPCLPLDIFAVLLMESRNSVSQVGQSIGS